MVEPSLKNSTILVTLDGEDITERVNSIRFKDKIHGSSSDLQLSVEDADFTWINEGKPNKNQEIEVELGYDFTDTILPANRFQIDSIQVNPNPTTFTIKCQQTPLKEKLREKRDEKYEDTSLKKIAQKIANRNGLSIAGELEDIPIKTANQKDQTDLAFLKKLADDWGQIVKLDRKKEALVFNSWENLESKDPQFVLARRHLSSSSSLEDSMIQTYKAAKVKYRDADKKEPVEFVYKAEDFGDGGQTNKDEGSEEKPDVLKVNTRVENKEQARLKAKEALRRNNKEAVTGRIETEGNWVFRAGVNFELQGFGPRFDGVWTLDEPEHTFSRNGGWRVRSQIRRLRSIDDGDTTE